MSQTECLLILPTFLGVSPKPQCDGGGSERDTHAYVLAKALSEERSARRQPSLGQEDGPPQNLIFLVSNLRHITSRATNGQ